MPPAQAKVRSPLVLSPLLVPPPAPMLPVPLTAHPRPRPARVGVLRGLRGHGQESLRALQGAVGHLRSGHARRYLQRRARYPRPRVAAGSSVRLPPSQPILSSLSFPSPSVVSSPPFPHLPPYTPRQHSTKPPKDAAARPSPSASPSVDVSEGSESKGEDAVAAADAPAAAAAGPEPGTAAALAAAAAHASSPVPKAEGPQP